MKTKRIRLTYETVTEESAAHGDFATHGFVTRNLTIPAKTYLPKKPAQFRLREAVDFLLDRSSEGPVEADSCPVGLQCPPRWFTYGGSMDANGYGRASAGMLLNMRPSKG